jgi:hypothetical protein
VKIPGLQDALPVHRRTADRLGPKDGKTLTPAAS